MERWRLEAYNQTLAQCGDGPRGWALAAGDPAAALIPFPALRLREGMTLRAYIYRNGGNAHSRVLAAPAELTLPAPPDPDVEPPTPDGARGDPMEAVTGDGSAQSYAQASILQRELADFCARGHGTSGRLHHVLGDEIWADPPLTDVSPSQRLPSGIPQMWSWNAQLPRSFVPAVIESPAGVLVTFFTYTALDVEQIVADLIMTGKSRLPRCSISPHHTSARRGPLTRYRQVLLSPADPETPPAGGQRSPREARLPAVHRAMLPRASPADGRPRGPRRAIRCRSGRRWRA
jgi:hypothetical protein